jgi:hypothetical protein
MVALPSFLQRWNFIERARLERELWDAFERGEDIEALVASSSEAAGAGQSADSLRREVWQQTLVRIRRIEAGMKQAKPPAGEDDR